MTLEQSHQQNETAALNKTCLSSFITSFSLGKYLHRYYNHFNESIIHGKLTFYNLLFTVVPGSVGESITDDLTTTHSFGF
jgi:hypothetical protein